MGLLNLFPTPNPFLKKTARKSDDFIKIFFFLDDETSFRHSFFSGDLQCLQWSDHWQLIYSALWSSRKYMIDYQPEIRRQAVMRGNACQRFRWLMTRRNIYNTFRNHDTLKTNYKHKHGRSRSAIIPLSACPS